MPSKVGPAPGEGAICEVSEIFSGDEDFLWLTLGFVSPTDPLDALHIACGKTQTGIPEQDALYLERTDHDLACSGQVLALHARKGAIALDLTPSGAAALGLPAQIRFTFNQHPALFAQAAAQLARMEANGQSCIAVHGTPSMPPTVEQVLALDVDALPGAIAALTSSAELHQFCLRFNVNDGFDPLYAVIAHPQCDAGTALYIYWQFHELLADEQARADMTGQDARWNPAPLLASIERRYPHAFAHQAIPCDPALALGLETAYVATIRERHPNSPLMQPFPGGKEEDTAP